MGVKGFDSGLNRHQGQHDKGVPRVNKITANDSYGAQALAA